MNYTKTPNVILESISDMCEVEIKLTMFLVRETYGYHRNEARLTYSDLEKVIGRGSIKKAAELVENRGFFKRAGRSNWVISSSESEPQTVQILNQNSSDSEPLEDEIVQDLNQNSSRFEPQTVQDLYQNSSNLEPLYKERKKEEKKTIKKAVQHPIWKLPKPLNSDEFETAWIDWFKHRHELGRPLTQTAGEMDLGRIAEWGEERAIKAIRHSIRMGWRSIHEQTTKTAASRQERKTWKPV